MTETSRFWDGTTVGDATSSPYDAVNEFAKVLQAISYTSQNETAHGGGVFAKNLGEMSQAVVLASVTINTGMAIVDGTWYSNSAIVNIPFAAPATATRIDRIVLRKDWVLQTVRLVVLVGIEGGSEPPLATTLGVKWDIPICAVSITTAGVITITDEREMLSGISGSVGPSNTRATKYVPLIPAQYVDYMGVAAGGGTFNLPAAVNPKAIAVAMSVAVTILTHVGILDLADHASNLLNLYPVQVQFGTVATEIEAAVLNINPGTPCTIDYVLVSTGTVNVRLTVSGYYEYIA